MIRSSFKTHVKWLGSTDTQAQLGSRSPQITAYWGFAALNPSHPSARTGFETAARQTAQRWLLARAPRRSRRAYTLIEVLVTVAIFSMVMTAVAVAMQAMYRVDRQLKDNGSYRQVVPRLSLQLRTDVHAASDVALLNGPNEPDGISLTLANEGEVIEYQSKVGRVVRTRWRDGRELGREVYYLGKTSTFRWRKTALPSRLVEFEIVRPMGKIDSADSRQVDRIVAAIGIRTPRGKEGATDASPE